MNHTKGQVYPDGTVAYYKDAKAREMISTDYDSTASYAVGDYCMYDNVRYCCNTAIGSGGETWNSSHWDEAKVDEDISEIKQSLSNLDGSVSSLISGLGAQSLIQYTAISSTESTYNTITVGGVQRKFSDYRFILFLLQYNQTDFRDSLLINSSFWQSGVSFPRNVLHGLGGSTGANYNVSGVTYKYNSDTSLKAVTGGNGTFQYIQVLGIGKI